MSIANKDRTGNKKTREQKDVDIITFDIILLPAYVYYAKQNDNSYRKYCADVIKRHGLPPTLGKYIEACQDYL